MKKLLLVSGVILMLLLTSCVGGRKNEKILNMGFDKAVIDRIVIVNTRGGVKYTIIDDKSINRIKGIIVRGRDAETDIKLDPDFLFEFYDGKTIVASFNYIAGISDKKTANLAEENGELYHVSTMIEDEFVKRIMKSNVNKNVPEYYISSIEKILESSNIKEGSEVVVDLSKDYTVTKYILSVDQKRILDSIDKKKVDIKLPGETETQDYTINVRTDSYTDTKSESLVSVTDKDKVKTDYYLEGTFESGKWSYYIRFK
ncbi:MAG: hypothetical protein K0R09_3159 [Clostridiales bacterium]|jgi:hypothetical protein|nr:hypothetical protein [Clostridiales bacterium]